MGQDYACWRYLSLRVKDVSFERRQVVIRGAKGFRDRVTVLPDSLAKQLRVHLQRVRALHDTDRLSGLGRVSLTFALERKYPRAGMQWAWQFVFPSQKTCLSPTPALGWWPMLSVE